jgi:hypothetical protein
LVFLEHWRDIRENVSNQKVDDTVTHTVHLMFKKTLSLVAESINVSRIIRLYVSWTEMVRDILQSALTVQIRILGTAMFDP